MANAAFTAISDNPLFGNRAAVVVGEIAGGARPRTIEMHRLLQLFEPDAVLTDNIWGFLWGKLGYGAMLFATALTEDSMAENFADPARFAAKLRSIGVEMRSSLSPPTMLPACAVISTAWASKIAWPYLMAAGWAALNATMSASVSIGAAGVAAR